MSRVEEVGGWGGGMKGDAWVVDGLFGAGLLWVVCVTAIYDSTTR